MSLKTHKYAKTWYRSLLGMGCFMCTTWCRSQHQCQETSTTQVQASYEADIQRCRLLERLSSTICRFAQSCLHHISVRRRLVWLQRSRMNHSCTQAHMFLVEHSVLPRRQALVIRVQLHFQQLPAVLLQAACDVSIINARPMPDLALKSLVQGRPSPAAPVDHLAPEGAPQLFWGVVLPGDEHSVPPQVFAAHIPAHPSYTSVAVHDGTALPACSCCFLILFPEPFVLRSVTPSANQSCTHGQSIPQAAWHPVTLQATRHNRSLA